jgi:hypothetical protein
MASLGARCLSWPSQHSISQQRQPIPSAARTLRPGPSFNRAVHRRMCCHAAASDQKNTSEPMSLRDLIMFEVSAPDQYLFQCGQLVCPCCSTNLPPSSSSYTQLQASRQLVISPLTSRKGQGANSRVVVVWQQRASLSVPPRLCCPVYCLSVLPCVCSLTLRARRPAAVTWTPQAAVLMRQQGSRQREGTQPCGHRRSSTEL